MHGALHQDVMPLPSLAAHRLPALPPPPGLGAAAPSAAQHRCRSSPALTGWGRSPCAVHSLSTWQSHRLPCGTHPAALTKVHGVCRKLDRDLSSVCHMWPLYQQCWLPPDRVFQRCCRRRRQVLAQPLRQRADINAILLEQRFQPRITSDAAGVIRALTLIPPDVRPDRLPGSRDGARRRRQKAFMRAGQMLHVSVPR